MRTRDELQLKPGTQNIDKMIVITFQGWSIDQARYNTQSIHQEINMDTLSNKSKVRLWYTMYGHNKYVNLPFTTQAKRDMQWKTYPLNHLKLNHHYAVYAYNADVESHNTDASGQWYWYDTFELTSKYAENIVNYKMSLRDRDEPIDSHLVRLIGHFGSIKGSGIYNLAVQAYGDPSAIKKYQWKMAIDKYANHYKTELNEIVGNHFDSALPQLEF